MRVEGRALGRAAVSGAFECRCVMHNERGIDVDESTIQVLLTPGYI